MLLSRAQSQAAAYKCTLCGSQPAVHAPRGTWNLYRPGSGAFHGIDGEVLTPGPAYRSRGRGHSTLRMMAANESGVAVMHGRVVANPAHKYAIVVGRFNDLVTKLLLEGAIGAFRSHGATMDEITVCWVPGSFELPLTAKAMAKSGKYNAVVCIGVVVRGATTHYDAVVSAATSGVLNASLDSGVPVVFGVLTCDTMEQALDRAGGKVGNKGGEAALTAIEMANLLEDLRSQGLAQAPWGSG